MKGGNKETIELEGRVVESLPNTMFRVSLEVGGQILAHLCGKMKVRYIRVLPGDQVRVEISKYDPARGRITYRLNKNT